MEIQEMLTKIRSVTICLNSHPDCEPDSEFQDRIDDLLKVEAELKSKVYEVSETHRNQIVVDLINKNGRLVDKNEILKKELAESNDLISSNIDENLKQFKTIQELSEINAQLQKSNRKLLNMVSVYNEK